MRVGGGSCEAPAHQNKKSTTPSQLIFPLITLFRISNSVPLGNGSLYSVFFIKTEEPYLKSLIF